MFGDIESSMEVRIFIDAVVEDVLKALDRRQLGRKQRAKGPERTNSCSRASTLEAPSSKPGRSPGGSIGAPIASSIWAVAGRVDMARTASNKLAIMVLAGVDGGE